MKTPLSTDVELEFFKQLWHKSSDPFWLCECVADDFVLVAVNEAQEAFDARIAPGLSLRAYFGDGTAADDLLSGYVECRNNVQAVVFQQRPCFDGEEYLFQTLLVPVTDAGGRVTHLYGTARDLTPFLRSQRELEALNAELERRIEERTQDLNMANTELLAANRVLEQRASRDGLTELFNRRSFFDQATAEVARARRYGHPLAVLMLDVDHFKYINDNFGHQAGDNVLMALSSVLHTRLRHSDLAARIGGEEFVILLPESNLAAAGSQAERLRCLIAELAVPCGLEMLRITVSIGVAELQRSDASIDVMLTRADRALYQAKREGRDRVRLLCAEDDGTAAS